MAAQAVQTDAPDRRSASTRGRQLLRGRPGAGLTNEQRRRVAAAILEEFDIAEAIQLIVDLGLGWAEPYDREEALGIKGLPPREALAKIQADLRAAAGGTDPAAQRA